MAGTCKFRYELSDSVKYGEFLDYLSTSYVLKKDSIPFCR